MTPQSRHLLPIKVGNKYESKWMADSGSPRTFINTKTAYQLLTTKAAVETGIPSGTQFTYFNSTQKLGVSKALVCSFMSNKWQAKNARLLVVENNHGNIIGRDLLPLLGVTLKQLDAPAGNSICNVSIKNNQQIKELVAKDFNPLCTRIGK